MTALNKTRNVNGIFEQNGYEAGDIVFAKEDPVQTLVIRRYYKQIYYCAIQDDPDTRELVYFERELIENKELLAKNIEARKGIVKAIIREKIER